MQFQMTKPISRLNLAKPSNLEMKNLKKITDMRKGNIYL